MSRHSPRAPVGTVFHLPSGWDCELRSTCICISPFVGSWTLCTTVDFKTALRSFSAIATFATGDANDFRDEAFQARALFERDVVSGFSRTNSVVAAFVGPAK